MGGFTAKSKKWKVKKLKYKNYYKILELKGPKASDDEIKSSYRKLAFKYHPDRNQGNPEASEKFKDVNEAWDTLRSPKKKKRYNIRYFFHFAENGIDIDLSWIRKAINQAGSSEFVKIFIGEPVKEEVFQTADDTSSKLNLDEEVNLSLSLEEAFQGVTKQITYKPYGEPKRTISVRIPRGSTNGTRIMLKGEGQKANFGSENGNLYINVLIMDNLLFKLDKNDLIKNIEITPAEAAIGCEKSVSSIDMTYKLSIPAGTQPGDELKIKEAGFISKDGKRGDLRAIIKIEVPKELTNAEKELYTKLKELHS